MGAEDYFVALLKAFLSVLCLKSSLWNLRILVSKSRLPYDDSSSSETISLSVFSSSMLLKTGRRAEEGVFDGLFVGLMFLRGLALILIDVKPEVLGYSWISSWTRLAGSMLDGLLFNGVKLLYELSWQSLKRLLIVII